MSNPTIITIILSMLPISELRGAIPFAIASKIPPLQAFIIATLSNIIIIPIIFLFLDYIHKYLIKFNFYKKIIEKQIDSKKSQIEKNIGTKWEFIALALFVGVPLPLTGAYSGCLLAWFFKLKRKQSYLAIILGVILAGIIVTLASIGLISIFS